MEPNMKQRSVEIIFIDGTKKQILSILFPGKEDKYPDYDAPTYLLLTDSSNLQNNLVTPNDRFPVGFILQKYTPPETSNKDELIPVPPPLGRLYIDQVPKGARIQFFCHGETQGEYNNFISFVYEIICELKKYGNVELLFNNSKGGKPWEQIPDHNWDRSALELFFKGLTYKEIGNRLNKSQGTIMNRFNYLRKKYGEIIVPKANNRRNNSS